MYVDPYLGQLCKMLSEFSGWNWQQILVRNVYIRTAGTLEYIFLPMILFVFWGFQVALIFGADAFQHVLDH
jgi:predicted TIM-barrel fold metal-dependent hydrolase